MSCRNCALDQLDYLRELTAQGIVILAGRTLNTDATAFGIVIFQAKDGDAARKIVENDPAVANQVMHAELFPYRTALIAQLA